MSIKSANKFLNPLESDDVGHVKIAKIVKKILRSENKL